MQLRIVRAKPNPAGKDKQDGKPIASKLQGEWVDVKNEGVTRVAFAGVSLDHTQYDHNCGNPKYQQYWSGNSQIVLGPGAILRIHTGKYEDRLLMAQEDMNGAELHSFANLGSFVLNNDCGDHLTLWFYNGNWTKLDHTSYDRNPPEGVVLRRVGDKLVPALIGIY